MKKSIPSPGFLNHLGDTAVCIIQVNTQKILFCNQQMKNLIPSAKTGELFCGLWNHSCTTCPFSPLMGSTPPYLELPVFLLPNGQQVTAYAELMKWEDGSQAYLLTFSLYQKEKAEKQFTEDQEQLIRIFSDIYPIIYEFNYTTNSYRYLNFNQPRVGLPDSYGSLSELLDYTLSQIHPSHREQFLQVFDPVKVCADYRRNQVEKDLHFRHLMNDGSYHWLEMIFRKVERKDSKDICMLLFCRSLDQDKRTEEMLLSEQRSIFNTLPGGVAKCIMDGQPKLTIVSSNLKDLLHIRDNILFESIIHPDYREEATYELCSMARQGADISLEIPIIGYNQQLFWMVIAGKKIGDKGGYPLYHLVMMDVTSHHEALDQIRKSHEYDWIVSHSKKELSDGSNSDKIQDEIVAQYMEKLQETQKALEKAELEKRRSSQRFVLAVSDLYEAIYEADIYQNTILVWKEGSFNSNYSQKYETLEQHFQIAYNQYVHPDFKEKFRQTFSLSNMKHMFKKGTAQIFMEYLSLNEEGIYQWMSMQVQLLKKSAASMEVMIYLKNIDKTKKEELQRQTANLEALQLMQAISATYDLIISNNLTQNSYYMIAYDRYLNRNAPADGVFDTLIDIGTSTVPDSHKEVFYNTFNRRNLLKVHAEGQPSVYLEHPQFDEDGALHWISTHVMFTSNPYTDDIMAITLSRCIDDMRAKEEKNRRVLEDALLMAEQANEAKSDFLSRISHDIRTPMNAIIGMTTIAETQLHEPEKVEECLEKISSSSQYLLDLINDILDFSRIESGKITISQEPFDLQGLIQDVSTIVSTQAAGKNQTFRVISHGDFRQTYVGDALRIKQILMNLLSNAHKYTPEGGLISLTISGKHPDQHTTLFQLVVTDTGSGIAPEYISKIFDPFCQGNNADNSTGSGLGLSITKNLVHLMDGHISVSSQPGQGSTFTVELPLTNGEKRTQPSHGRKNAHDAKGQILFHGERILLAEDNELNQEIAVTILEMHGLTVDVAHNGKEAVDYFLAAPENHYLAILMDIQMPVMDGYDAARAIRSARRADAITTPIYAMTANSFAKDVAAALACGMNGHVSKPVDFDKLTTILQEEISKKSDMTKR